MSIKKNNTYFQENDGKIYYYNNEGIKKEIPASAFGDLQDQIDNLGSPLTYSGAITIAEANALTSIKQGTVYTVTGVSGTLTAGDVEVKEGDEIAWADPKWVEIGKDHDNSWKQWSEDNGSSSVSGGIYIGKNNSADYIGINIGAENQIFNGDDTLGASINIGKNNVNRYGILIGQRNESQGYGYSLGDDNTNIYYGDIILGYENKPNYTDASRVIIGVKNNGNIGHATTLLGREISASYVNSDSTIIGSNFAAYSQGGSIIIAQNGYDSDRNIYNNRVSITAENDAYVIGGYSTAVYQTAYKDPGIQSKYNSLIVGQGQNISAESDSIIFGNQSIAKYGSKVIGSHGYAEGDSMVINWPNINYNVTVSSNKSNYVDYTLPVGYFYKVYNGNHTIVENVSGEITTEHSNYHMVQSGNNHAVLVLNIRWNNGGKGVYGKWDSDGKVFTEGAGSQWAYKLTGGINDDAVIVEYYNGNITVSSKAQAGTALPIYYDSCSWVQEPYDKHNIVTDGRYVYLLNIGHGVDLLNQPNIPSFFIDPDFIDEPRENNFIYDARTKQLGYTTSTSGNNYKFRTEIIDVLPSAVLSQKDMVTISQAYYGSLALGPRNSAYGGSIAINVTDKYSNVNTGSGDNYTYNLTHNYTLNNGYLNYNKDYTNSAAYGSIAIGLGSYAYYSDRPIIYPNTGNYAYCGSFVLGTNISAEYGSFAIGGNASARNNSVTIGPKGGWNCAEGFGIVIGNGSTARYQGFTYGMNNSACGIGFVFGLQNTGGYNGYAFGLNQSAISMGWTIGNENTACYEGYTFGSQLFASGRSYAFGGAGIAVENSLSIAIKGGRDSSTTAYYKKNIASAHSLAIGYQNYANRQSYVIGYNNIGECESYLFGMGNVTSGYGIFVGNGNKDYMSQVWTDSGDPAGECVDIFGRWNEIVGSAPTGDFGTSYNRQYTTTILGYANKLIITGSDSLYDYNNTTYNFNGIFIGQENQCYMSNPGGYNIYLGKLNKGAYESINIGTENDTMGHSIALGWRNKAVKGGNAHTIFLGNGNTSKNTQGYIYGKSYPVINQQILTTEQINNVKNQISALQEQLTTAYQNRDSEINKIYKILTANGIDAVSAENYLNGTIYNSGYGHGYIYPYSPWTIESYPYGFSYKENGTWITGYGESAYIKNWIYGTSAYSSYDTSDYYYKYYWLPAKQASAIWKEISAIYKTQYGSNSSNRYNSVNTALNIISNLNSQISDKYTQLSRNPITNTTSTDQHNIETMSFVVGQGNSADHHNSIIIGSENHSLKMINDSTVGDDGFTVAIGVGNTVTRNYDMAIGYGAVAYGGENIAIGVNTYQWYQGSYTNPIYTSAVGIRNVAIRSNVTGLDNIAVNSFITGGISSNLDYCMSSEYSWSFNTNFERNKLFDAVVSFSNTPYSIHNNNFDNIKRTNLDISNVFDENDLRNVLSSNINVSTASRTVYHNVINSTLTANQDSFNTYDTVMYSNIVSAGYNNSFNTYKDVHYIRLSAENIGHNFIYDIGDNYSDNNWHHINLTSDYLQHNIIINAGLQGSWTEWPGITNNFMWKSCLYSTTDSDMVYPSHCITENVLIGTFGYDSINESFSFGSTTNYNQPVPSQGNDVYYTYAPLLKDCNRIWNFGNNKIMHGYDTFVAGESNYVDGIDSYTVMGRNNFVYKAFNSSPYQGSLTHESVVLGSINAIYLPNNVDGYKLDRNFIIGQANTIIPTSFNSNHGDTYNGDLRIIGNHNHFAGIPDSIINTITGINGIGSIFPLVMSNGYASILPISSYTENEGYSYASAYSAYPVYGVARNTIIGSKSVISNHVVDSNTIGLYNAIYQEEQVQEQEYNSINDVNVIGSYNLAINGSHQFNVGFNNITSGHHSTAMGEELRANAFQTILGKYNSSAEGTTRTTMRWNSATNTVEQVENTGVLLAIGNGRLKAYEKPEINSYYGKQYYWYNANGTKIDTTALSMETLIERSNAMIVSADGTVSARRFIESEPALTITGGDFVTVTEDTTNNKLVIDLESSLGQMLTELSGVLTAKPSTGRHILGVDNGTLTWLEVNQ